MNTIKTILFLFLLNSFSAVSAQYILIKGRVIDHASKKGVTAVHIIENGTRGSITNADGNFAVRVKEKNILTFSHIGYETKTIQINKATDSLLIKLYRKTQKLDEVVVTSKAITAEEIMSKVFDNFKKNHAVEPVYYNFYNRVVVCNVKDSTLHIIEEHAGVVKQNKLQLSKYALEKSRVKAFSEKGSDEIESHRVISIMKMAIDNILRYREDYLKKGGSKKYEYTLLPRVELLGRECYVIRFYTPKHTFYKQGTLYIDVEDYAIVKKTIEDSSGTILNEVNFRKENEKWYLKSALDYFTNDNISFDLRITLYNLTDKTDGNFIKLSPNDFSHEFASDFSDDFWENYNYIPLPNWLKEQMN